MIKQNFWSSTIHYKLNVDGVIFAQSQQFGVGVVIWDHEGKVTSYNSTKQRNSLTIGALEIEAKAMEVGVSFPWDVGIRDAVFECDSKIVSDTLLGLCTAPVIVSNILVGIVHKLQNFRLAQVSHVKQQGNRPTNLLAEHAKEIDHNSNYVT